MHRIAFHHFVLGVLALATNINASYSGEPTATATAGQRVRQAGTLVIAHRGDSKMAPENTLPAFISAVHAGADLVELDYYHSADGTPVVFHDKYVNRTTNSEELWGDAKIPLTSRSLDDLKRLDAGKWFASKFAGTKIPTLTEALDAIQSGSMTLIERKGGDPATCVALLKEKKLLDRVVVQAFDWDYLAGCHKLDDKLVLAALGDKDFIPEKLDKIAKTGAKIVAWEDKYTTASTISAIHSRGFKAWVWTVDDATRICQLVDANVDGIITNQPALTRSIIQAARSAR